MVSGRGKRSARGANGLPSAALAGAVVALLLPPAEARATVVRALSLAEKTAVAPVVVHAVVERVESAWVVPGKSIETLITLRVVTAVRGPVSAGDRLTVVQAGGQIGDLRQIASGQSTFEPGEELVVFLEPHGTRLIEIGIGIAKYDVVTTAAGKMVTQAPQVAEAHFDGSGNVVSVEPAAPTPPEPLDGFILRLRGFAAHIEGVSGAAGPTGAPATTSSARPN